MADGKKIIYLGDDTAYFKVLGAEFRRLYPHVTITQLNETTSERIQGLIVKIINKANLVFVDFSKNSEDYSHLARLLVRTNSLTPCHLIGLHDYLSPKEQIKESFLAGVGVNHIKSAEIFDVVFGAMNLVSPGQAKEHGFATAKMSEEIVATQLCKIGYAHNTGLHFETNLPLSPGEELRLKHGWLDKKLIPSMLVKTTNISQRMLFYPLKNAVDVEFLWVDPVVKIENDDLEHEKELAAEHEHKVVQAKNAMEKWLQDNFERSLQKGVRILVVERNLMFYDNRPRTDKYEYAIRCQPFIIDATREINAICPQVVAFVMDHQEEGKPALVPPLNDIHALSSLIEALKANPETSGTYVVVFGDCNGMDSAQLQKHTGYAHVMGNPGQFDPEVLLKMANLFKSKLPVPKQDHKKHALTQVFLKKSSPLSIGEIEEFVKITSLSESDAIIESAKPLAEGTTLKIETPFHGFLTIAAHPQITKHPSYYALVNGVNEEEKRNLRKFVNSLFFKDHDQAKLQELEQFKVLNDAKWQAMLEQQKAELEAREKAQKEEAEKKAAEAKAKEEAASAPATEPTQAEKKPEPAGSKS